ncbi:hypothetical protein KY289_027156 [Solanum tuberosum]|nr:hypothetical protein KY289_027156 [Solanum tuberosum]KAH0662047.1 hypothetical protein KY284_026978 [Solanum tuberosum]
MSNGYSKGDDIIANQNNMLIFQDTSTDAQWITGDYQVSNVGGQSFHSRSSREVNHRRK